MAYPTKNSIYAFIRENLDTHKETVCTVCKHDNFEGDEVEPCKTCNDTSSLGAFELDWSKLQ